MGLKCKKCDGEGKPTKYCFKCKKAFCESVITAAPDLDNIYGAPMLTEVCPECGSKSIIHYR